MRRRNLLLSALLAVSIGALPALSSDTEVLSDEELEDVSAQGLQTVRNGNQIFSIANSNHLKGSVQDQDNNLDSVQMRNNAQESAVIQGLSNSAQSSLNTNANFLDTNEGSFSTNFSQSNDQEANNHSNEAYGNLDQSSLSFALASNINKQRQYIENSYQAHERGTVVSVVFMQNNNNNSVQMRDYAQENIQGIMIFNASTSAGNAGFNMVTVNSYATIGNQNNTQVANNFNNFAQADPGALGGNAAAVNAEVMDNTPIGNIQNWTDPEDTAQVEGNPTQYIKNVYGYNANPQRPYQYSYIDDQNNNNNSVQSKDDAQRYAKAEYQANISKSASNFGINQVVSTDSLTDTELYQTNTQNASNHQNDAEAFGGNALAANVNKETQNIDNMIDPENLGPQNGQIVLQDNNNNSVQYMGDVQRNADIMVSNNSALSATNTGINVADLTSASGVTIGQTNEQEAHNLENSATGVTAYAGNVENTDRPNQSVLNGYVDITEQNNNNNSVQLKDYAQYEIDAFLVSNASKTASNNGINLVLLSGDINDSSITQLNTQTAGNHNNTATGDERAIARNVNKETQGISNINGTRFTIVNRGIQNNNNNSVQLLDSTQGKAEIYVSVNGALSSVNTAANAVFSEDNLTGSVNQTNNQEATNMSNTSDGFFAEAGNEDGFYNNYNQWIGNGSATLLGNQNNNNNSIQISDNAQYKMHAVISANAVASASNFATNMVALNKKITGNIGNGDLSSDITQYNGQDAFNHQNSATGDIFSTVMAYNRGKESQYVENTEGLYIADGVSQNNNNNSVQMTGSAQRYAKIVLSQNAASSALNTGFNLLSMAPGTSNTATTITQKNEQIAYNFRNQAGDVLLNSDVAYATNHDGDLFASHANQYINNAGGTIEGFQGNSNSSIMMGGHAQGGSSSDSFQFVSAINSANSAVNNGFNILAEANLRPLGFDTAGDTTGTTITQTNDQLAVNHENEANGWFEAYAINGNKAHQEVITGTGFDLSSGRQCNVNNSIKLTDYAQQYTQGLTLVNSANSALNFGINLINVSSAVGTNINQTNIGTARNWTNTAVSNGTAVAGNINW